MLLYFSHTQKKSDKNSKHYNLPLKGSRLHLAVGVVHTPLRSSELPSMVFILQNVSALLHVDRAGMSESRQLRSLGFSLCQNRTDTRVTNGKTRGASQFAYYSKTFCSTNLSGAFPGWMVHLFNRKKKKSEECWTLQIWSLKCHSFT